MTATYETVFVGGRFDEHGGKSSKIAQRIFETLPSNPSSTFLVNGGSLDDLELTLCLTKNCKLVYWFADVANDKEKIVAKIKEENPRCVLVTSKRNTEDKYGFQDLVYHALGIKSNLVVEFTRSGGRYRGRVLDPLGNVFLDYNEDFSRLGRVLAARVKDLVSFKRVSSRQIGEARDVPKKEKFFALVRVYADKFHDLIHANPAAANRFFGNASFRCENGFPSFKEGNLIYVSRRNVDKRMLDERSFVAVRSGFPLQYFGDVKPSVDTPVQLALYNFYHGARFMLHSHTYIEGAPMTSRVLPCGAVEEVGEITRLFPDRGHLQFFVNLRGHGSLAVSDDIRWFENIHYIARPTPELHDDYLT